MEFSNTCSVSLHPSRIIEHLMYFKNSLRGATNIPLGVIRVLFKIMCNKGNNYLNKFSSIIQRCRHALINNTAILRYIGFINK